MEKLISMPTLPGRRGHNTRVILETPESETRVKQAPAKGTEIRNIIKRFYKTGVLGDPSRTPIFGDFTNLDSFETNALMVSNVRSQFQKLSASTRDRFKNDPVELIAFLQDAKNDPEAVKLGLKDKSVLPVHIAPDENPDGTKKPVTKSTE